MMSSPPHPLRDQSVFVTAFDAAGAEFVLPYLTRWAGRLTALILQTRTPQGRPNRLLIYRQRKLVLEQVLPSPPRFLNRTLFALPLVYGFQVGVLLAQAIKHGPFNLYLGINYLLASCGVIARWLGKVERVIYYSFDYFPRPSRGPYRYLIPIFETLDRFAIRHADGTWFLDEAMRKAREARGVLVEERPTHLTVPLGIETRHLSRRSNPYNRNHLIFVGVLGEQQGLGLLFEALVQVRKEFPDIRLNVVGSGPYERTLQEVVKNCGLAKIVRFLGYIPSEARVRSLIRRSAAAVACYRDDEASFIRYTDASKIKLYLSCGVPILTSNVPPIAKLIAERGAGVVFTPTIEGMVNGLRTFFSNQSRARRMRRAARQLARQFDRDKILTDAFEKTFAGWSDTLPRPLKAARRAPRSLRLSVIIPTINGRRLLERCLRSLFDDPLKGFEVIVVDNGSEDDTVPFLRKHFPNVCVISAGRNLGFGRANNIGVAHARAPFLLFLNNDTVIEHPFFAPLLRAMEEGVGAVQPTILLERDPSRFEGTGDYFLPTGLLYHEAFGTKPDGLSACDILAGKGACLLVRREAFEEVGGFRDDFFLYFEETDLCIKLWRAGWRVRFTPAARLHHLGRGSSGDIGALHIENTTRNRLASLIANLPADELVKILPLHLTILFGSAAYFLIHAKLKEAGATLRGMVRTFEVLPRSFRERLSLPPLPKGVLKPLTKTAPLPYYLAVAKGMLPTFFENRQW